MKLLSRNVNLQLTPNPYTKGFQTTNSECYDALMSNFSGIPKGFLAGNNVIFVVFHIWQLYLFFNAVFHEHSIQIMAICFFNFGWLFFGLVQGLEIKFPLNQLHSIKVCEGKTNFDPSFWTNDIPFLSLLLIFTAISTWYSLLLYKQFGWNLYKKIGGDVKMRDLLQNISSTVLNYEDEFTQWDYIILADLVILRSLKKNLSESSTDKNSASPEC
ncbi:1178_t:CDS:2 [Dentiscutata erythropus]|uniref:1178_t:CDS:1 n=1 Tax=Dentiscutata erythropus TaxID=1348616 RepID=A0A9N9GPZ8_9GLOM|nr:1178_t:CDS:2 [Dentiscutata erythropus]